MQLSKRVGWTVMCGIAGAAAAQVAERAITSGWRLATDKDPPDPAYEDVSWRSAVIWTVVAASAVGLTQLVARQGAAAAWHGVTGRKPPRPRRRKR